MPRSTASKKKSPPIRYRGDVRERLLNVSLRHFGRSGFEGVPVSSITKEAGVAKGTFFNHFPTKDHVLSEAFHRLVTQVVKAVEDRRVAGTEAILIFTDLLAERIAADRVLAVALAPRFGALPPPRDGEPREEDRIRRWIGARLGEALPLSVPLVEPDPALVASLLTWSWRAGVEEWSRGTRDPKALQPLVRERIAFILRSYGLPAVPPIS